MSRITPIALALLLGACGSLGGEGGGGDNLPNRGIVPYDLHDNRVVDEPNDEGSGADGSGDVEPLEPATTRDAIVVPDTDGALVLAPAALANDDGTILLAVEVDDADGVTRIDQTSSEDGIAFGALSALLGPSDVSDGATRVGAPAVVRHEDGLLVAFELGDGASIGIASFGSDGPREVHAAVLEAGADTVHEPSLVRVDDEWWLYYEARVETDDGPRSEIRLSTNTDWRAFDAGEAVFGAGEDCIDAFGEIEGCWDRRGVGSPEVRIARTALGRRIFRLWYAGGVAGRRSLGFASSFDGREWVRFPFNPVVAEDADEWSPTNVFVGGRYLLYGASDAGGVWAAVNDRPEPSEVF